MISRCPQAALLAITLALASIACRRDAPRADRVDHEALPDASTPDVADRAPVVREPKVHRPRAVTCTDLPLRRSTFTTCTVASDCPGHDARCEGGYCTELRCRSDADCSKYEVCTCGSHRSGPSTIRDSCLPANCHTDRDCGPGGFCSPSLDLRCGSYIGVTGWYCHGPKDACIDDEDCPDPRHPDSGYHGHCAYSPIAGHYVCSVSSCVG